jgi:hypothetical protein
MKLRCKLEVWNRFEGIVGILSLQVTYTDRRTQSKGCSYAAPAERLIAKMCILGSFASNRQARRHSRYDWMERLRLWPRPSIRVTTIPPRCYLDLNTFLRS